MNQSHHELPFFIDTPFARIDTEHRANITEKFFKELRGQLCVFSTNEEIRHEHIAALDQHIANMYGFDNWLIDLPYHFDSKRIRNPFVCSSVKFLLQAGTQVLLNGGVVRHAQLDVPSGQQLSCTSSMMIWSGSISMVCR